MVMQQDQYAYPAPSTFDPTQVYVPNRFQQTYAPQSYVDQYGLQSAFPLVPGLPVPGGEGGGEAPPVIQEATACHSAEWTGFHAADIHGHRHLREPRRILAAGGAPAPEGGYFQQEGAPTYEGVGSGALLRSCNGRSCHLQCAHWQLQDLRARLNPFLTNPQTAGQFGTQNCIAATATRPCNAEAVTPRIDIRTARFDLWH